jgi:hypothetical protein
MKEYRPLQVVHMGVEADAPLMHQSVLLLNKELLGLLLEPLYH